LGNQFPDDRVVATEAITRVRGTGSVPVVCEKTERSAVPGAAVGAGSALMRPGRRIVAGETLWEPLNPPHPETRAEAARMNKTAMARNR
jgi:hypothetical protein